MRGVFLILSFFLMMPFVACNKSTSVIENYYISNTELHMEIADSLLGLVKKYGRNIDIRIPYDLDSMIIVRQDFPEFGAEIPIEYDKHYNRKDSHPNHTSKTEVPISLLKKIRGTIYSSFLADKSSVFFGFKYYTNSDFKLGLLIYGDGSNVENTQIVKQLSENVCIYKEIGP